MLQERILLLMKALGLNPTQFADEIGVQRSSISHILSGRNNPSLDIITKILRRFGEVDSNWLVLGKGAMFSKKDKTQSPSLFDEIPLENSKIESKKNSSANSLSTESLEKKIENIQNINSVPKVAPEPKPQTLYIAQTVEETKPQMPVQEPEVRQEKPQSVLISQQEAKPKENKHITKIIIFYSDSTFEELEQK